MEAVRFGKCVESLSVSPTYVPMRHFPPTIMTHPLHYHWHYLLCFVNPGLYFFCAASLTVLKYEDETEQGDMTMIKYYDPESGAM